MKALSVLLAGTAHLSWRYYTSAAFEHPIVFSLFTLLWCAVVPILFAVWSARPRNRLRALVPAVRGAPWSRLLSLVAFVVGRTLLFGCVLVNTHCSIEGIHAFLPALLAVLDAASLSKSETLGLDKELDKPLPRDPSPPPSPPKRDLPETRISASQGAGATRGSVVRYVVLALAWGFAAHQTLVLMERPIGAICPSYGGWDQLIPAAQILMLVLDTLVISQVARIRRRGNESSSDSASSSSAFLGVLSLCSALALTVSIVTIGFYHQPFVYLFSWAPAVEKLILHDLVYDSVVAAAVLISAFSLLSSAHPATIAVVTGAAGIFFHYVKQAEDERSIVLTSAHTGLVGRFITVVAVILLFFLIRSDSGLPNSAHHSAPGWTTQRWLTVCYFGFLITLLARLFISPNNPKTVFKIINSAQKTAKLWIQEANRSDSLQEAANEYRMRYGIPPPPNFDKWYEFAVEKKSPIIDSFDQIHDDLLPFWGVPPALLRKRTTHLLEQTHRGIGGFRIKDHKIHLSPHTPGSHFWMMQAFQATVEPFLTWLPDMDLAFNIDDECRVVVPFGDMQLLKEQARQAQKRVPLHRPKSFSAELGPPWSDSYLADDWKDSHGEDISPFFSSRSHNSIFDTHVAPACPPTSPTLKRRWWSRKAALPSGRGVVTDPDTSVDLCQRPDIARMHGFLLDPGAFSVTRTLFPIFSQSRISGFADILVPSPWNLMSKVDVDDAADRPWAAKADSVFWRGSASDGASNHNSWATFLRARFAWLAKLAIRAGEGMVKPDTARDHARHAFQSSLDPAAAIAAVDTRDFAVNVSFVGNFTKCDPPDCLAQATAFYGASEVADPPLGIDFQEHWAHQHLVDLDGAGFSGRFIPFVKSQSLVYRASLFRTWYDERIHAWEHFVPLDVSLVNLWGLVKQMGRVMDGVKSSYSAVGESKTDDDDDTRSVSMGEKIALGGREWALKALRKEDMQVYMFRLLLEWARLIDDRREELGSE